MIQFFQRLGKSLMLPVATLPICGILMGIGYLMCPSQLAESDIQGIVNITGYAFRAAGGAVINNISWVFVVGVGVGMSLDKDASSAVAALVSWLLFITLLSPKVVAILQPQILSDDVANLAFEKVQSPFLAIVAGVIGAACYNKFKNTKTPDFLSFFSGKRFVVVVTVCVSFAISVILIFVWPLLFRGIYTLGQWLMQCGGVGAAIYVLLNRLLLPFGLHHALNNVFWFDTIGIGDLTHFWAGHTSQDVSWDLGIYMSGFFPCMMFGVAGAALAMIHAAKNRKKTLGILLPFILCAFFCGVTEPFEFSFMFIAIPLYVVYSFLYGIITLITCFTGFRAGFAFSGGAIDFVAQLPLPGSQQPWMLPVLGAIAFVLFYLVFIIAIKKFHCKVIGSESNTGKMNTTDANGEGKEPLKLTSDTYSLVAQAILDFVGGKENIKNVDYCATRLRFELDNADVVKSDEVTRTGAIGMIKLSDGAIQIVIGTKVQFVYDELKKLL